MTETNKPVWSVIRSRVAELLTWDVAPFFRWIPATFKPVGRGISKVFSALPQRTSNWRVSAWWPSDSTFSVQRSLLRLLAVAHRERLELVPLIRNFADEHRIVWRWRLRRLANRIEVGTPLVDAIEQTPDVLDEQHLLALRFATQSGILADAYQDLLQDPMTERQLAKTAILRVVVYAIAMVFVIALMASFLLSFVLPTIASLAEEFGVTTPWAISSQLKVSAWVSDYTWFLFGLIGLVAIACWCSRDLRRVIGRCLRFCLPRLDLSQRPAELLRLLSLASKAGRPISGSLSTLARYHYDKTVRQKLLFIRNEVEQGANVWSCLCDSKLINTNEAEAIRHCTDGNMQAWTLRQLANSKSIATTNRMQQVAACAHPVVVIIFAAIVAWLSLGYFQFLSGMVYAIQGWQAQ